MWEEWLKERINNGGLLHAFRALRRLFKASEEALGQVDHVLVVQDQELLPTWARGSCGTTAEHP